MSNIPSKIFIGIDPGVTGAITLIYAPGQVEIFKMPKDIEETREIFIGVKTKTNKVYATIEEVHSSPQQGNSTAFKFGYAFGLISMAAECYADHVHYITPYKWQSALNCLTGGDKRVSKAKVEQLFPELTPTLQNADSILLAFYCYQKFKNE